MVTRIRHEVLDDLTGAEGAITRSYSVDGQRYEIDLVEENWAELQDSLKKFIAVSRKQGTKRATAGRPSRSTSGANAGNAKIREWARAQGMTVPERGRIPEKVREAYDAAN